MLVFSHARFCRFCLAMSGVFVAVMSAGSLPAQTSDPAVEQLKLKAAGGPTALGNSINSLSRMGEWKAVDELLSPLEVQSPKPTEAAQIASQISSDQRLKIAGSTDVGAPAKKALDALFQARRQSLRDPAKLQAAIAKLTSNSEDEQLGAYRTLFEGGEAASAALIGSVVTTNDADQQRQSIRVLLRLDREAGIAGLRRVALYGNDEARSKAIDALSDLNLDETRVDLLTRNAGVNPGPAATQVLRMALVDAMDTAVRSQREFGRSAIWAINAKRDGVVPGRAAGWVKRFRDAADAASRLAIVGDTDPASVTRQLTAQLAYRVANDPDWGDASNRSAFVKDFFGGVDASQVLAGWVLPVLELATQTDNDPAAIGALRLIDGDLNPAVASALLQGPAGVTPLVEAVDHPNAAVRYEAASAIARLTVGQSEMSYAGISRVRDRYQQMATMGDRGIAIIMDNQPEIISAWDQLLHIAGYESRVVGSVAALERLVSLGEDLRLIVAKAQPLDTSAVEMIDVIRRIRVGRDVPLLIYTPASYIVPMADISDEVDLRTDAQKEFDANLPDRFGVKGGIATLDIAVERSLLYGDVDFDRTIRRELDLQFVGQTRWEDQSLRAGLIRSMPRPRSVAGLYELMLDSRARQHVPPLTPTDRVRYRNVALDAMR